MNLKYCLEDIKEKRTKVAKGIISTSSNIKSSKIMSISTSDLKLMLDLYDEIFFNNWFRDNFKGVFNFSLSTRMTKSAGKTICPKNISKIKPEN
jgi:hypothetical protein